jgi:hypothetical protein
MEVFMRQVILVLPASIVAGVLVVAGLWAWNGAADWVLDWGVGRPDIAVWAVRSAAIAVIAAAQVILLSLVGAKLYGRGAADSAIAFSVGAICAMASLSAAACAFYGR